jgi:hypothetical protein
MCIFIEYIHSQVSKTVPYGTISGSDNFDGILEIKIRDFEWCLSDLKLLQSDFWLFLKLSEPELVL